MKTEVFIGDRIKITKGTWVGETGVVASFVSGNIGIKFDEYNEGRHNLQGEIPEGYGWYVGREDLEKIEHELQNGDLCEFRDSDCEALGHEVKVVK